MRNKLILIVIIILVTIGIIYEGYGMIKEFTKSNKVLEDIKTIDVFKEKDKSLAIMIQSGGENDFEWYEAEDRTKWPDKTKYTYVGTECTDSEGVSVPSKNVLTFDETTYTAHIKTKQTIYCTLYFGKGRPALEVLDAQGGQYYGSGTTIGQGKQGSRVAVEGLYRFKGTKDQVTNNFVCIGGSLNPEKCGTESSNKYLYRIIGVTDGTEKDTLGLETGMLKVIKVIPPSTSQKWASDSSFTSNYDWDNANNTVRVSINGSGFYNDLEQGIKNIIPAVKWWKGDKTSSGASESKTKTTGEYQIGLMYQSDYYNAGSQDTNNWLHITNTMSGKTATYGSTEEWTMTREGYDFSPYWAWYVHPAGNLLYFTVDNTYAVRPVFYLTSTTGLVGNGTESSPYVITSLSNA